jgi:hypothetical protein
MNRQLTDQKDRNAIAARIGLIQAAHHVCDEQACILDARGECPLSNTLCLAPTVVAALFGQLDSSRQRELSDNGFARAESEWARETLDVAQIVKRAAAKGLRGDNKSHATLLDLSDSADKAIARETAILRKIGGHHE